MNKEYHFEKFSHFNEIEFKYLEKIDIKDIQDDGFFDVFKSLFGQRSKDHLGIVAGIFNGKTIIKTTDRYQDWIVLEGEYYERGDKIVIAEDFLCKIDESITKEFLEEANEIIGYNSKYTYEFEKDVLTRKDIEDWIKEIDDKNKKREEEKELEKKGESEKDKKKKQEQEHYEKMSVFMNSDISLTINKNNVIFGKYGLIIFKLNENVNKHFKFDEINYLSDGYHHRENFEGNLLKKKLSFNKLTQEHNSSEKKLKYTYEYEKNKNTINGVEVPANKVDLIIRKCNESSEPLSPEMINSLLNLGVMKTELIECKNISVEKLNIDTNFTCINPELFEIEIFNQKKQVNWEILKRTFFGRGRGIYTSLSPITFLMFTRELGFEDEDIFRKLKKIKALNGLENE